MITTLMGDLRAAIHESFSAGGTFTSQDFADIPKAPGKTSRNVSAALCEFRKLGLLEKIGKRSRKSGNNYTVYSVVPGAALIVKPRKVSELEKKEKRKSWQSNVVMREQAVIAAANNLQDGMRGWNV